MSDPSVYNARYQSCLTPKSLVKPLILCIFIFSAETVEMYKSIKIDRENLTLMGVQFSDLKTLEDTANAIGSMMFEGFEPTPDRIELIRDYILRSEEHTSELQSR